MTWRRSYLSNSTSSTSPRFEGLEHRNLLAVTPFSLEDVNATSASHGEFVSPGDFAGRTSAYYFGSAT